ncbi:hypothetical protein IEQ34_026786 [Dendrobium chrysotoxum]|uniref:Uncharacterized protein n=2 Tax=Dendrobium chrysotoxum TaxID=161865 RepID=A0AAV7FII2_DENCH|nr:hypothetical protein IEQ34_026786 [Dendrobium chrysotoxum]
MVLCSGERGRLMVGSLQCLMQDRKRLQIPTFGNWDYGDEMPITQYFESARQAGLVRSGFSGEGCDADLFNVPVVMPVKLAHQEGLCRRKVRKRNDSGGEAKGHSKEHKQSKQGKVSGEVSRPPRRSVAAPKAVDEDLYKIPPELLYQKPKRKRFLRHLFSGCLGLNCIA